MANNTQKRVQPSQIDQHKLNVGKVGGYIPSNENAPNSIPVRDENSVTRVYTLEVEHEVQGKLHGDVEGNLTGNVTGNVYGKHYGEVEGNVIGNVLADNIKAKTIDVRVNNPTDDNRGTIRANLFEGHFEGSTYGEHKGTFDGVSTGTFTGTITGENMQVKNLEISKTATLNDVVVNGVLLANGDLSGKEIYASNRFIGDLQGNTEGEHRGNVVGTLEGNADTATRLASRLKLRLVGAVEGEIEFDGSEDRDLRLETIMSASSSTRYRTLYALEEYILGDDTKIVYTDSENNSYVLAEMATSIIDYDNYIEGTYLNFGPDVRKEGKEFYTVDGKVVQVSDGGTGAKTLRGMIKGNGQDPFSIAEPGIDYVTNTSIGTFSNKTIDLSNPSNILRNVSVTNFDPSVIATEFGIIASDLRIPTEKAVKELVESTYTGLSWKNSVVCATTGPLDITKDFAAESVIDGVELFTGNRILIKDQINKAENGIYIVNETGKPTRANDADKASEITASAVYVTRGTANANTGWVCGSNIRNLETDSIEYFQFSGTNLYLSGRGISIEGNVIKTTDSVILADEEQTMKNKVIYGEFHGDIEGNSTGCTGTSRFAEIADTANNVAGGGTVSATTGNFTDTVEWFGGNSDEANTAYAERNTWNGGNTHLVPELGRASLGLGTISTQNADNVDITGGSIVGITPLSTEFGGTGSNLKDYEGMVKIVDGRFTEAISGVDYLTRESVDIVKNKSLNADENAITNLVLSAFKEGVISNSDVLEQNSDDVIPTQKAVKAYVDTHLSGAIWKKPVRCATLTGLNIATDLKVGTVIDGVTLNIGDRVLLKNQDLAAENGVFVITNLGAERASDFNSSSEFSGSTVIVLEGNNLGGTSWMCVTENPELWVTPIHWNIYGSNVIRVGNGLKYQINTIVPDYETIADLSSEQTFINKTLSGNTVFSTLTTPAGTLKFELNHTGNVKLVTSGNTDKIYQLPEKSGKIYGEGSQVIPVYDGGTGLARALENTILVGQRDGSYSLVKVTDASLALLNENKFDSFLTEGSSLDTVITDRVEEKFEESADVFIKRDGSNFFTGRVAGISPLNPSDLVTKEYVDNLPTGLKFVAVVESAQTEARQISSSLQIGHCYIVPNTAQHGAWEGFENKIVIYDTDRNWRVFVEPVQGDIAYVKGNDRINEAAGQKIWNGTAWQDLGTPPITNHESLLNIKGGQWHLTEEQYIGLVNRNATELHKHYHENLENLKGGNWHLTVAQYNDLTGVNASKLSTIHTHSHNDLFNPQGGKTDEYYHLTAYQYNSLINRASTDLHSHAHSTLSGILGDGAYHLSSDQYNLIFKGGTVAYGGNIGHRHSHNDAVNIQGGTDDQYYHLGLTQYQSLTTGNETNLHTHSHKKLHDLQGGRDGEWYHIDFDMYTRLLNNDFGVTSHNDLALMQGGKEGEYFHLPRDKYEEILQFAGKIGDHNTAKGLQGGGDGNYYHLDEPEKRKISDITLNGISHSSLKDLLGDGTYHLSAEQLQELTSGISTNLHTHEGYVKSDGSIAFASPIEGVSPVKGEHLATKSYVDYAMVGLKWVSSVSSMSVRDPSVLTLSGRYAVPRDATGSWRNKYGCIAEAGEYEWIFTECEINTAMYDEETAASYVWIGTEWAKISASPILHKDLGDLHGGDWHLEKAEHDSLISLDNSNYHYHNSDRELDNAIGTLSVQHGGTGLSEVPAGMILYSTDTNAFNTAPITTLGRRILAANSLTDLRSTLPYGSMASQDANNVDITGGTITGITPLGVSFGGTGTNAITGIIKGNGTNKFESAVPNVDYLTPSGSAVVSGKTINAENNNILNLTWASFSGNVLSTDSYFSYPSDDLVPTTKAVKSYVDSKTTGFANGKHEFISSTHAFTGAPKNSILIIDPDLENKAKYKTITTDDMVSIDHLDDTIKISLRNRVVTLDSTQTLENKMLRLPMIPGNEFSRATHTHVSPETGGLLSFDSIEGTAPVTKGGTGITNIPKNHMLYATADNHLGTIKLGRFMILQLTANTYADFMNNIGNTLSSVKSLVLSNPSVDPSYTPNIQSDKNLDITVNNRLNLASPDILIGSSPVDGTITSRANIINNFVTDEINTETIKYTMDFSDYPVAGNKGLYIKDSIVNKNLAPTSSLTVGGTMAIVPSEAVFSAENTVIEQVWKDNNMHSSVILLTADDSIAKDYTVENLEFVLVNPADVTGQMIFLKLTTECKVKISAKDNATIDGENSLVLTQKYMSVTLYSNGTEWLII